jgi:hypothetical protein
MFLWLLLLWLYIYIYRPIYIHLYTYLSISICIYLYLHPVSECSSFVSNYNNSRGGARSGSGPGGQVPLGGGATRYGWVALQEKKETKEQQNLWQKTKKQASMQSWFGPRSRTRRAAQRISGLFSASGSIQEPSWAQERKKQKRGHPQKHLYVYIGAWGGI